MIKRGCKCNICRAAVKERNRKYFDLHKEEILSIRKLRRKGLI